MANRAGNALALPVVALTTLCFCVWTIRVRAQGSSAASPADRLVASVDALHSPAREVTISLLTMGDADRIWELFGHSATLTAFEGSPVPLTSTQREEWVKQLERLSLSSDGFIPFRDNVDRAARAGVGYVLQPGGSTRDDEVIAASDEYGIWMGFSGLRLFYH